MVLLKQHCILTLRQKNKCYQLHVDCQQVPAHKSGLVIIFKTTNKGRKINWAGRGLLEGINITLK